MRPPCVTTCQPAPGFSASRRAGVDGHHDALVPELVGGAAHEIDVVDRRGVERHLVGSRAQHPAHVFDGTYPPADGEGNEDLVGHTLHDVDHRVAIIRRRGDVEEHELVGALRVVAGRELDRIAGVADLDEPHALHDATGVDVEAGNYADSEHAAIPSATVKRPS